jgi:hypothetical protein
VVPRNHVSTCGHSEADTRTVPIRQAKAALSAVVVPVKEAQRLYPQITPSLADFVLAMPRGPRIAFARDTTPLRGVRL